MNTRLARWRILQAPHGIVTHLLKVRYAFAVVEVIHAYLHISGNLNMQTIVIAAKQRQTIEITRAISQPCSPASRTFFFRLRGVKLGTYPHVTPFGAISTP